MKPVIQKRQTESNVRHTETQKYKDNRANLTQWVSLNTQGNKTLVRHICYKEKGTKRGSKNNSITMEV